MKRFIPLFSFLIVTVGYTSLYLYAKLPGFFWYHFLFLILYNICLFIPAYRYLQNIFFNQNKNEKQ